MFVIPTCFYLNQHHQWWWFSCGYYMIEQLVMRSKRGRGECMEDLRVEEFGREEFCCSCECGGGFIIIATINDSHRKHVDS